MHDRVPMDEPQRVYGDNEAVRVPMEKHVMKGECMTGSPWMIHREYVVRVPMDEPERVPTENI